ncbi:hypothetical protein Tco_0840828 [Tanacetum coccineum]|uniref:Uncharacterized protein n=1 Tax=Tanacetum coccineum TaxID=301880 RepID=A0ABQ5AUP4_9ASTR
MSGRPTAGQPPSSPANFPATTTSSPPEKFSGGLIRPTPKILPTSGSTQPITSLSSTRRLPSPSGNHSRILTTITPPSSSSTPYHHYPPSLATPADVTIITITPPQRPPQRVRVVLLTTKKGACWLAVKTALG